MSDPVDFYGVLNIPKNSSPEDIRKAYKALVRRWHPDKNPPSSKAEAEAKFKAITEAYEALSDKDYRSMFAVYHTVDGEGEGSAPPREGWPPKPSPSPPPRAGSQRQHRGERAQVPRKASGDGHRQCYAKAASGGKAPAVERKLECTLEELYRGCRKEIRFTRAVIDRHTGMIVRKEEVQFVKVKPGWKKGTRVTFENMGDERPGGGPPSDVVYVVAEKEHPLFRRVGNDLVLKAEVPLVSALTGWTFSFRLISGEKMSCSGQDVVHPGYEKVIPGQGMPLAKEKGARGDLRIKFRVVFPEQLTEAQRSGIRELFKGGP